MSEKSYIERDDGIELELVCIVHSSPPPEVSWLKNGQQMAFNERIKSGKIGRKHLLTMKRLTAEADAGTYQCKATNDIGTSAQDFQVLSELSNWYYQSHTLNIFIRNSFLNRASISIL